MLFICHGFPSLYYDKLLNNISFTVDHMVMKGVLDMCTAVGPAKQPLGIGDGLFEVGVDLSNGYILG
jgi:hypothetical protein